MERPKERETLERTLHKRPLWQFVCKPSLGSGHNQLKWKQRLHHLFPLRALLLHKSSDDEILRALLKEETPGYQVIPYSQSATETRMSSHLILEVCPIVRPRFRGSHTKLISADAHAALSSRLLFFCTCSAGNQEPGPRKRESEQYLARSFSYLTQFTIWARRHLNTLISCFPQLFT